MYPRRNRSLLLCAALLGAASLSAALVLPPASADPVEPIEVALLGINDFHGEIDATTTVQFAGTIEGLRASHGEDSTLVLSAGDILKADEWTTQNPRSRHFVPTLDVLNALDVRANAVGNHEFHNGYGALRTTVTDTADFPMLSANIFKSNSLPFLPFDTFDVAGLKVAVIGATTRLTPALDARVLLCGLGFTDPVEAVNATAANLKTGPNPPDIIVAVYHEGAKIAGLPGDDLRVGTLTSPDVDVVFAGHTHKKEMFAGPVPGVPGKTRPVIQAGEKGEWVSEVVLTVDPVTKEVLGYQMGHKKAITEYSRETLIAMYPRVAAVDTIVTAALATPPGLTPGSVPLC